MGILDKMIAIADAEGVTEECQIRKVEAVDVYFNAESWATEKSCLGIYLEEFPKEIKKWKKYEGEEGKPVSIQLIRYLWRVDWSPPFGSVSFQTQFSYFEM